MDDQLIQWQAIYPKYNHMKIIQEQTRTSIWGQVLLTFLKVKWKKPYSTQNASPKQSFFVEIISTYLLVMYHYVQTKTSNYYKKNVSLCMPTTKLQISQISVLLCHFFFNFLCESSFQRSQLLGHTFLSFWIKKIMHSYNKRMAK